MRTAAQRFLSLFLGQPDQFPASVAELMGLATLADSSGVYLTLYPETAPALLLYHVTSRRGLQDLMGAAGNVEAIKLWYGPYPLPVHAVLRNYSQAFVGERGDTFLRQVEKICMGILPRMLVVALWYKRHQDASITAQRVAGTPDISPVSEDLLMSIYESLFPSNPDIGSHHSPLQTSPNEDKDDGVPWVTCIVRALAAFPPEK